jgi:signal transduction histidine kinase
MKIRTYLLVFALAILLPMIAFSAIAVVAFDRQQRAVVERGGIETARALMNAVDRELGSAVTTLQTLATARSLERGDLAMFQEDSRRVLSRQRGWITITLFAPTGRRVMDLATPPGAALMDLVEPESFETVRRTGRPAIGAITAGPRGRHAFAVRVPVLREGAVVSVLTGVIEPAAIGQILTTQQIPTDWVGTVFDSTRTIVARTRGTDELIGRSVSPEFARLLSTTQEGWAITHTLEGAPAYTAFSRSWVTGWGVGIGIPLATIDGPLRRSLWAVAGGGVGFLVAAVVLSLLVGQRIARPIAALSSAVGAFGQGLTAPPPIARSGPQEIAAVARAFEEAMTSAQSARAEAEAANHAKDEFLALLSHELRTPLNAVYGWARILRTTTLDPARTERALDAIERNAGAQIRLVEDLLDISRIVTGKMRLELRPVSVPTVVEAALDSVRPAAEAKGILLESLIDQKAAVLGDPDRLQQVVWNLVSNAIKFTPGRGRVTIAVRRVGSDVEVVVSDTGLGIDPVVLPYVFDRFRQGDSSSTRSHGGLGLGLALVRHLTELHGGRVTATSPGENQGATFTVRLPSSAAGTE